MKTFTLKELLKSPYKNFFTYEELYGRPDPKRLKYDKEQKLLNEGLILTHPIEKSIKVIENAGFEVITLQTAKYQNRFFVEVDSISTDFSKLFKITDNLGWFCSEVKEGIKLGSKSHKYTPSNLSKFLKDCPIVFLLFEPKYDLAIDPRRYDYLYHFTTLINLNRIKEYGLTPKTQSKISTHPERIYLAYTAHAAEKFGRKIDVRLRDELEGIETPPNHNKKEELKMGVILKITVTGLPSYFKIYQDPNYYEEGCFTLNSIPYSSIDVFKKFDLDY